MECGITTVRFVQYFVPIPELETLCRRTVVAARDACHCNDGWLVRVKCIDNEADNEAE